MSKNPLIVFEGIECSGKSTQINHLLKYLKKIKKDFISLREPGGTKNSELIRSLILNNRNNFNPLTDTLLYLASRSEFIKNVVLKYYKKRILIIDRFYYSTIAYQHYGFGVKKKLIIDINKEILKKINPSIIFLCTVSMKNLNKRLKLRKKLNRYDKFDKKFYYKVQKGYLKYLRNKKNVIVLDSNKDININKKIIEKYIQKIIK